MAYQAGALTLVSYEDYLANSEEGTHTEWVNGEVIPMSPVSRRHQLVWRFLLRILSDYVEAGDLGEVQAEPFQMKTGPKLPGRAPDIIFIAKQNLGRLKDYYLDGPADLVVEIISPESQARDRGEEFSEYQQGGVREYWLVDPIREQTDFYIRGKDGLYHAAAIVDGAFHSEVLKGLWLRVDWLWQDPLPSVRGVIKEWGISI